MLRGVVGVLDLYIRAFLMLFIIFNPISSLPIFISLTDKLSPKERRIVARKSSILAGAILLVFLFFGWFIFDFFQVTVDDFRIAGGILLLILGIDELIGEAAPKMRKADPEEIAVVPLATPLLAGPGSITTVLVFSIPPFNLLHGLVAIVLNMLLALAVFCNSETILRFLGRNGVRVVTRIMGLMICAIAVSMIREGIMNILSAAV